MGSGIARLYGQEQRSTTPRIGACDQPRPSDFHIPKLLMRRFPTVVLHVGPYGINEPALTKKIARSRQSDLIEWRSCSRTRCSSVQARGCG